MVFWHLHFFSLILLMSILASVNCNGLRCADIRKLAFSFFKRNIFDIIFLQETHWYVELGREWEGDAFFAHGTNSSQGVAILITSCLGYNKKKNRSDNEGRVLNMILEVEDRTLNLINFYAPSKDSLRRAFFLDSSDNIMGGDINCIFNSRLDKLGGVPSTRHSVALLDVRRERDRDEHFFTWTGVSTSFSFVNPLIMIRKSTCPSSLPVTSLLLMRLGQQ